MSATEYSNSQFFLGEIFVTINNEFIH
jgi:hypothetical protein